MGASSPPSGPPHVSSSCAGFFSRWPAEIHHPQPAGTSFQGERVIVSHVRSVFSPSSETAKQVALCVFINEEQSWNHLLTAPQLPESRGRAGAAHPSRRGWFPSAEIKSLKFQVSEKAPWLLCQWRLIWFISGLFAFSLSMYAEVIQRTTVQGIIENRGGYYRYLFIFNLMVSYWDIGILDILGNHYIPPKYTLTQKSWWSFPAECFSNYLWWWTHSFFPFPVGCRSILL